MSSMLFHNKGNMKWTLQEHNHQKLMVTRVMVYLVIKQKLMNKDNDQTVRQMKFRCKGI